MSKALWPTILSLQSLHKGKTRHANHVVSGNSTFSGDSSCHEYAHPGVAILIMALLLTISILSVFMTVCVLMSCDIIHLGIQ